MVKAAHFMSCVIHGKIQQTFPTDGFLYHGFICSRIVVATLLHHGENPLHSLIQGPTGIFTQINIKDVGCHGTIQEGV